MSKSFDFKMISHVSEELDDLALRKEIALNIIGQKVTDYAVLLAPVDTGRLKNSITWATQKTEGRTYQYTDNSKKNQYEESVGVGVPDDAVVVGTNVEYAAYQEVGTSKTKAQPFLYPAVVNHIAEYKRIAADYLAGKK